MKWGEITSDEVGSLRGVAWDWGEGRSNRRTPGSWGQGPRCQEPLTRDWLRAPGPPSHDHSAVQSRLGDQGHSGFSLPFLQLPLCDLFPHLPRSPAATVATQLSPPSLWMLFPKAQNLPPPSSLPTRQHRTPP